MERPTFYRHFSTLPDLFSACSSHGWATNPPPDPEAWRVLNDPDTRLRVGLLELYAYYERNAQGMWVVLRDLEDMAELRPFASDRIAHRKKVCEVLAGAWRDRGDLQKLLTAAIGHAVDFFTWRSLRRQGLTNEEAVQVMLRLVRSV